MKIKNVLSVIAFLLAITAAFAFNAPTEAPLNTIEVRAIDEGCPDEYFVSNECTSQSIGTICKTTVDNLEAVPLSDTDCSEDPLRDPNP